MTKRFNNKGMGLVEILIGSAIIVTGILALSTSYGIYTRYALANDKNVQAGYLIEEELEGIAFLRDKGWNAYIQPLSTTTTYYVAWSGGMNPYWQATTTPQYVEGTFLRSFTIGDVFRDANGLITNSSGTYDSGTRFVTATISYMQGNATTTQATTTQTISTYVTNLYGN